MVWWSPNSVSSPSNMQVPWHVKHFLIPNLVGGLNPSEKYESQWEGLSHILFKKKMFETTNQKWYFFSLFLRFIPVQREKLPPSGPSCPSLDHRSHLAAVYNAPHFWRLRRSSRYPQVPHSPHPHYVVCPHGHEKCWENHGKMMNHEFWG